ncbi:MAG: hypothetical protein HBSAPP04_03050 [Ignavibacteriaceae bacterium]|nr:MAG: hypothetical protein HBSAPP04_03050 [Ignavibacteriaceae bacterium]
MRRTALIFFVLIAFAQAYAGGSKGSKEIKISKSNSPIEVDGKLNETVWQGMPLLDFYQRDPDEGKPSTQKTAVKVTYDDEAFYVGAYCYDSEPDSIVTVLARKDQWVQSDYFMLFLDPYFDKRSGYYFYATPSGSVGDGTLFNSDWDESSWNGVWEAKTQRTGDGWTVEMRIPFSQLRFNKRNDMTWGINFKRNISRRNEQTYYILLKKNESGFVSKFAELKGFEEIGTGTNLEVLPYMVQKAQYLIHDQNDPFYKSSQYKTTFGADLKWGLNSNLTFDMTVNPDFGLVEVDPAVLNLSAYETFYDEKRPFFIEGSNLLAFGYGGSNNNWGFNWGGPDMFYSRRIGKAPTGPAADGDFVDYPGETQIIGAAKLTGKISDGWSVYALNAVTNSMNARSYTNGLTTLKEVQPLSNATVFRTLKEFDESRFGLGFMGTSMIRKFDDGSLRNDFSSNSYAAGVDGWVNLDSAKVYVINGYFIGTGVNGSKEYINDLQQSSIHFFQRPDMKTKRLDPNATSLNGWAGRVALNKQEGEFYVNAALGAISPGFNVNDLGFAWKTDIINGHLVLGLRDYKENSWSRSRSVYAAYYRSLNFDGETEGNGFFSMGSVTLLNFYQLRYNFGYEFEKLNTRHTRGGPSAKMPSGYNGAVGFSTDQRNALTVDGDFYYGGDEIGSNYYNVQLGGSWRASEALRITVYPGYEMNYDKTQWVANVDDASATRTYGTRHVFGYLDQKTLFATIRLDYTFTPTMSLQLFAQPFISIGKYSELKELDREREMDYTVYGTKGTSIGYDDANGEYVIDPGTGNRFAVGNPDFNFKSLRLNLIYRWEFLPGSTLFLVWSHDRTNFDDPGQFQLGRSFANLMDSESNNIFMAKITYWFNAAKFL